MFARCLARITAGTLRQLGGGEVLEIGGGSGALAADLLAALRDAPPDRYLLLDVSGELRARQRATLAARVPDLLDRVVWLESLPQSPVTGVLLANEVLDALPFERVVKRAGSVSQLGVQSVGDALAPAERPAPPALAAAVHQLERALGAPFADGYRTEIGLRQADWLRAVAESLGRGLFLCIDYGGTRHEVYHPERSAGTLACHYRHRRHADPFFLPGLQDLTAWVDFSAAAASAKEAGLQVAAYATQAHALLASGVLDDLSNTQGSADPRSLLALQEVQRLLLPGEMGERFKVLALTRAYVPEFALTVRDLSERL